MSIEQLAVPSGKDTLEVIHFSRPQAPLVLFCHGFPGVYKHLDLAEDLFNSGFGVMVMKYRGVDKSTGFFDFTSAIEDVEAVVNYGSDMDINPKKIGVFGYSIGAYYALNVASRTSLIRSVCVLSPVSDLPKAARAEFEDIYQLMLEAQSLIRTRGVADLVGSFAQVWEEYNLPKCVKNLHDVPLLIIEGTKGEMSYPEQAQILYDSANEPKKLYWMSDAGHFFTEPKERKQLSGLLDSFFKETLGSPSQQVLSEKGTFYMVG